MAELWKNVKVVQITVRLGDVHSFEIAAAQDPMTDPCEGKAPHTCAYNGTSPAKVKILSNILDAVKKAYPKDDADGIDLTC